MANIIHSLSLNLSYLGKFWQEKANQVVFRWNIFFIIFSIGFLILKFSSLPSQVPFYFSLPWGESQLTSASTLFLLPTFSIIIATINNLLAAYISRTQTLFSRLLVIFSLLFSFLSTVALVNIIFLVA